MTVFNYVRVSSDDQDCARQRHFFADKGGVLVEEEQSARDLVNRPVLQSLIEGLQPGDSIRALSVDRIARSVVDAHAIVQRVTARGASLDIVGQGLSFTADSAGNPVQKMLFSVLAAFAEFERATIRERQAQGYAAIRAGVRNCKGTKKIHRQKAIAAVLKAVQVDGLSYRQAAKEHGVPPSTVCYMVKKAQRCRAL
jgi:DNA invertase Pin-like site-specific DNA recombinase